jgi:adenosylcobinamide-phosphate synthase
MIAPLYLILAFFLDLCMGDPRWLPHPVRMIGKAITRAELSLRGHARTPWQEKRSGIFLVIMIVVPSFLVAVLIQKAVFLLAERVSMVLATVLFVYLVATTIATRELVGSVRRVLESVKTGRLKAARGDLGMIVGRDTQALSDREVLKAAMETVAENLSDGVIAPIFYLTLGGFPLAVAYKAINTLDSMVGYKNATYINFGWAAARLDDLANYLPARITGFLIIAAVFITSLFTAGRGALGAATRSFQIMRRDGRNHTSPNSGIPEAAMAGAVGIRMGGPSTYGGVIFDKPYIGETYREDYVGASEEAITIVLVASLLGAGLAVALLLFIRGAL